MPLALRWSRFPVALAAVALTLAAGRPALADDETIEKMSAARIERIMKSFSDVKNFKETENGTYAFEVDGLKVLIFNQGETLQLYAGFSGTATGSRINEWNRSKRFSKAYLSEKGEPRIESDLQLTGGVSEKNVKAWMGLFVTSLKSFKKHLEE